jgi:hypothetical protein
MHVRETGWGIVDFIRLAQVKYRWQAVGNQVMNLRFLARRS